MDVEIRIQVVDEILLLLLLFVQTKEQESNMDQRMLLTWPPHYCRLMWFLDFDEGRGGGAG